MIKGRAVDHVELVQIIFEWGVVTMPSNDIVGRVVLSEDSNNYFTPRHHNQPAWQQTLIPGTCSTAQRELPHLHKQPRETESREGLRVRWRLDTDISAATATATATTTTAITT